MSDAVELLRDLIRIDTTNPPGNERPAVELIASYLHRAGITTQTIAQDPDRPSLIARVRGEDTAPPLLLQGHIDTVPVTDQRWSRDPFGAEVVDGFLWGRGTLDMKGPVVMMAEALRLLATHSPPPAGDVILAVVPDEEMQGTVGARFLVTEHAELFDGVRYCLGEFGGFPFSFGETTFYPIQIAERIGVGFEVVFEGPPGHGSMPIRGGAMGKLGTALRRLDRRSLPVHLTEPTRLMVEAIAGRTSGATRFVLERLLDERTAGAALKVLGDRAATFDPLFRNTVSATIVQGGDKHNVIPPQVTLNLDGRMLPGFTVEEFTDEVRRLIGVECDIRAITDGSTTPAEPDMGLFDLLADALVSHAPEAVPIPFLLPAVTDGRWFAQLGIQPYGFTPMNLPPDFDFQKTVHGVDERIPVSAIEFGAGVLRQVLDRYGRE
ncbi:MAG: M20/M25/M40 family metallo-hydrolase [Acidimicrobiia bacterium]|nr:M20/M25/M40 family metallo-hydrolase [Acidimicrobiia bacterium]